MKIYTVKIDESGTKRWYLNDKLHRTDGPAVEYANGSKLWYLNHVEYTKADWRKQLKAKADWRKQLKAKADWRKQLKADWRKQLKADGVKYKLVKI
jgi:hypothetical protein